MGKAFDLAEMPDLFARYNVAPTQDVPVVRLGEDEGRGGMANSSVAGLPTGARDARYFGQNNSTLTGMPGTGAAIANQAGQPSGSNRYRAAFTDGGVTNSNPSVQSRFGGPNNGQGYSGQSVNQGASQGFSLPDYRGAAGTVLEGGPTSRFSNVNSPRWGGNGSLNNGLPVYTSGQNSPGVWSGSTPYSAPQNSAPPMSPTTNNLAPGTY